MRNARMTIWLMVVVLISCFCLQKAMAATIIYDDGLTHSIGSTGPYYYDRVEVKDSFLGGVTTANLLSGNSVYDLKAYDHSLINISGGLANNGILAYDFSEVYITDGGIPSYHALEAYHSSKIYMSGGEIGGHLYACNNSNVYISGGTIDEEIRAYDSSTITFIGNDFVFGGVNVGYGEYDTGGLDWVRAPLSWTLSNGDQFNYVVYFESDSTIVLIPEPATLLLLGLGTLVLRKSKLIN